MGSLALVTNTGSCAIFSQIVSSTERLNAWDHMGWGPMRIFPGFISLITFYLFVVLIHYFELGSSFLAKITRSYGRIIEEGFIWTIYIILPLAHYHEYLAKVSLSNSDTKSLTKKPSNQNTVNYDAVNDSFRRFCDVNAILFCISLGVFSAFDAFDITYFWLYWSQAIVQAVFLCIAVMGFRSPTLYIPTDPTDSKYEFHTFASWISNWPFSMLKGNFLGAFLYNIIKTSEPVVFAQPLVESSQSDMFSTFKNAISPNKSTEESAPFTAHPPPSQKTSSTTKSLSSHGASS